MQGFENRRTYRASSVRCAADVNLDEPTFDRLKRAARALATEWTESAFERWSSGAGYVLVDSETKVATVGCEHMHSSTCVIVSPRVSVWTVSVDPGPVSPPGGSLVGAALTHESVSRSVANVSDGVVVVFDETRAATTSRVAYVCAGSDRVPSWFLAEL